MGQPQELALQRSISCKTHRKVMPSTYARSTSSFSIPENEELSDKLLVRRRGSLASSQMQRLNKVHSRFSSLLRSIVSMMAFPNIMPTTCKWLAIPSQLSTTTTPSLGRKVTGTLFGHRRGHVSFAVQDNPLSEPVLLLELAMSTSSLVKEMSSGLVRIALECEKGASRGQAGRPAGKLFHEPMWTMYCNGRKYGYAVPRTCTESDWHVLGTIQRVSIGAGVIPVVEGGQKKSSGWEGELLYMRAKFERVVGSRDSEAFYMMNPDKNGGPELSIFLLRV